MARTSLPEPLLRMESPLGELDVHVVEEGLISLRGEAGMASYDDQQFRTTGLLLEESTDGWKVRRDQFEILDIPGGQVLGGRVIAALEPAAGQWA